MEIFKLFGSVFIENDKANKSLDATDKKAKDTGGSLAKLIAGAAKVGAGVAAGIAAGTAALFGMANKAAEATDVIDKLSERTGIGVVALQEWSYAASQSGADIGKLEVGMKTLSGYMDDAMNGSKKATDAFSKLGISVEDLKNKSQEDIFNEIMYAFSEMPQGAERNAIGNDLLGKSYTELLPLLNAGAAGMDELRNRAHDLGLVMSEEAVDAGVVFGDTLADVKDSFSMMITKIGIEAMPVIQDLLDWILKHMPTIQNTTAVAFDAIGVVVDATGQFIQEKLIPALEAIYEWVEPYIPQIEEFFIDLSKEVETAIKGIIYIIGEVMKYLKTWLKENKDTVESVKNLFFVGMEYIKTVISTAIAILKYIWSEYGENLTRVAKTAWDYLMSIFKLAIDLLTGIYKIFTAVLKGDWSAAWEAIKETTAKAWQNLKNVFSKYIEALKSLIDLGLKYMGNAFELVFGGIKDTVTGILDNIVTSVKNTINSTISAVNMMIRALNSIKIEIPVVDIPLVGKVGGGSIGLPYIREIPLLAKGGNIKDDGAFIVGEKGPEILSGMRGAQVTPLDESAAGITLNIYNPTIMTDRDIDIFGERLVRRLKVLGVG